MRRIPFFVTLILTGAIFYAFATKQKEKYDDITGDACIKNDALYEPMLTPTKEDSINFEKFFDRYPNTDLAKVFTFETIPLVRGIVDTSVYNDKHYKNYNFLDASTKLNFVISPLIAIGEVVKEVPQDTANGAGFDMYKTALIIKIKKIIKSDYNISPGDLVVAKTILYGPERSTANGEVVYSFFNVPRYQKMTPYLFVFDKYHYMERLYRIEKGFKEYEHCTDTYCPYAFSINVTTLRLSQEYDEGKFDETTINNFLRT